MGIEQVLIIGAGTCGLAIAHGLGKASIPFCIFDAENDSTSYSDEWTATLDRASISRLKSLFPENLADRLETDAVVDKHISNDQHPNNTVKVFDGVGGKVVCEVGPEGESLRVSERKIKKLLYTDIEVRYCGTLHDIEFTDDGNIIAIFENGECYRGSVIIGADGPGSIVRKHLFGSEKAKSTPLGAVYFHTSVCYPDADTARFVRNANLCSGVAIHEDCIASVSIHEVLDPERPETWRFELYMSWKEEKKRPRSNGELRQQIKAKAQGLNEPFRSAILWIPENVEIQFNAVTSWTPVPWHSHGGRLTLAGEAAMTLPRITGQTLENEIEDAYNFVNIFEAIFIGDRIKAEAIPSYGHEIVARGAKEVQLSRNTTLMLLNYANFKSKWITRGDSATVLDRLAYLGTPTVPATNQSRRKLLGESQGTRSPKVRKALSQAKAWMSEKIENMDRGAQQGTAQTGWIQLGHREYGRRYFPD